MQRPIKEKKTAPISPPSQSYSESFVLSLMALVGSLSLAFGLFFFLPDDREPFRFQRAAPTKPLSFAHAPSESSSFFKRDSNPVKSYASASIKIKDAKYTTAGSKTDLMKHEQAKDPRILEAITLIDSGNPSEAVGLLEKVLESDPNNEQALTELGMIYVIDFEKPQLAITYLEKALSVNPNSQVAISELLSLYEDQNEADGGLNYLQTLQQRHPDSPDLSYGVGRLYHRQGRSEEAIPYLEKAAQSQDLSESALQDLADAYMASGQGDRAVESYMRAIEREKSALAARDAEGVSSPLDKQNIQRIQTDLANLLIRQGRYQQAESLLYSLMEERPGNRSVSHLLDKLDEERKRRAL